MDGRLKPHGLTRAHVAQRDVTFSDTGFVFIEKIKRECRVGNALAPEVLRDRIGHIRVLGSDAANLLEFAECEPQYRRTGVRPGKDLAWLILGKCRKESNQCEQNHAKE